MTEESTSVCEPSPSEGLWKVEIPETNKIDETGIDVKYTSIRDHANKGEKASQWKLDSKVKYRFEF